MKLKLKTGALLACSYNIQEVNSTENFGLLLQTML